MTESSLKQIFQKGARAEVEEVSQAVPGIKGGLAFPSFFMTELHGQ